MRTSRLALCSSLIVLAATAARGSGGQPMDPGQPAAQPKTPTEIAAEHYNDGLSSRDQALALQKKADDPALAAEKREGLQKKIRRAYEQAATSFERALEANPSMHEAWSMLGFARRKTGDYASALAAYDRALELKPGYAEAIEYRGEAYLGLNRVADARTAYEALVQADAKRATELLGAMEAWVAARRADPAGLDPATVDELERWIGAQRAVAPAHAPAQSRGW